jgi:competence protein ComEC
MTMAGIQPYKKWWREGMVAILLVANVLVWINVSARASTGELKVHFLDVGQGDAILIESPNRGRVLIDGGRNRRVLSELGKVLSFADRRIDVLIATHPDADHIGGFPEVITRYDVGLFMESALLVENSLNNLLRERLDYKKIDKLQAMRGQVINFGDGARLTILFPDRDVSNWNPNDASIVARLDYGEISFLFTGDAGIKTENILISLDRNLPADRRVLDTDVLQAGHHGSRTSTSLTFAQTVMPEYAVISAGKNNSYGHPHQEVINNLEQVGAVIKSTAQSGTITFKTDGKILKVK